MLHGLETLRRRQAQLEKHIAFLVQEKAATTDQLLLTEEHIVESTARLNDIINTIAILEKI